MNETQEEMWDRLCELDGETVARLLTDYHGLQLLDDGFYEFLIDEGYLDEPEEEEPENDEDFDDEFSEICMSHPHCGGCPFWEKSNHGELDCEELFNKMKEETA